MYLTFLQGFALSITLILAIGAQNAFDQDAPIENNNLDGTIGSGNRYATSTPWGFEGQFLYGRVNINF